MKSGDLVRTVRFDMALRTEPRLYTTVKGRLRLGDIGLVLARLDVNEYGQDDTFILVTCALGVGWIPIEHLDRI